MSVASILEADLFSGHPRVQVSPHHQVTSRSFVGVDPLLWEGSVGPLTATNVEPVRRSSVQKTIGDLAGSDVDQTAGKISVPFGGDGHSVFRSVSGRFRARKAR